MLLGERVAEEVEKARGLSVSVKVKVQEGARGRVGVRVGVRVEVRVGVGVGLRVGVMAREGRKRRMEKEAVGPSWAETRPAWTMVQGEVRDLVRVLEVMWVR